jgi:hypothetical protein
MSTFENYAEEARQLEMEIERKGLALGIDWTDMAVVGALAREVLDFDASKRPDFAHDRMQKIRFELMGLAGLMLQVMTASANDQVLTHGGTAWKALGRALWKEWQARQAETSSH